jgi:hypothetical protein
MLSNYALLLRVRLWMDLKGVKGTSLYLALRTEWYPSYWASDLSI